MSKYRTVSPQVWLDSKYRGLSDSGKLVWMMLLTHPDTSSIGTMRTYPEALARDLGWTLRKLKSSFREIVQQHMMVMDETCGLIWLPNYLKYNAPANPNSVRAWAGAINDMPECPLKDKIINHLSEVATARGKGFAEAFTNGCANGCANGSDNGYGNGSGNGSGNGMPNLDLELELEQEQEKSDDDTTQIVQSLVAKYHGQCCPPMRKVKAINDQRKQHILDLWKYARDNLHRYDDLASGYLYWYKYFQHVKSCPWLTGKVKGRDGTVFVANFDWLTNISNYINIIEGKYNTQQEGLQEAQQ